MKITLIATAGLDDHLGNLSPEGVAGARDTRFRDYRCHRVFTNDIRVAVVDQGEQTLADPGSGGARESGRAGGAREAVGSARGSAAGVPESRNKPEAMLQPPVAGVI